MDDFIRPTKKVEQPEKKKSFLGETVLIIVIIISLGIGFAAGYFSKDNSQQKVVNNKSSLVEEAYQILEDSWYNTTGQEVDVMHDGIIGLVAGLGDRNTAFWSAKEATDFNATVDGNYVGVGVGFHAVSQGAMVTKVYTDTPAMEANIQTGDIIVKANDTSLAGKTSEETKDLIRGKEGTTVKLILLRGGKSMEVEVARKALDVSVNYAVRENEGKKFGYIEITTFGMTTGEEVARALETFTNQGIGTLVFDFRDNTGGYLLTAKDILSLLFEEGEVIYQMQGKEGPIQKTEAIEGKTYSFSEGYVLVNGQSASASEIIAGALQEELGYKLIGTKTFGKGTAQTQQELSDGSILKYTYARWLTPKGTSINGKGLTPDIEVNNIDISNIVVDDIEIPLQYDQVSDEVMSMQKMLSIIGYAIDRKDGYFSNQTKEILQQFEKDNGLAVDGVYSNEDHQLLIGKTMIFVNDSKNDKQYTKLMEVLK